MSQQAVSNPSFVDQLDKLYLLSQNQELMPSEAEKQETRDAQRLFLDLAASAEAKQLPYSEDRQRVEIGMTPSYSSDPTCIKFNSVIINIVQRNLDKALSIQALDIWNDYLEQDEKLRSDFVPSPEMFMQMNLRSLLVNVVRDG